MRVSISLKFSTPSFAEAIQSKLVDVGEYRESGRKVQMQKDAARALQNLIAQARRSGISIIPISGFRTLAYQASLFKKAVEKYGSEQAAARWVARPGFSEHHTGFAVDLGDEESPSCDTEPAFERTSAFKWLKAHAGRYEFELSFPAGGKDEINYEPWHWRFTGTDEAKKIFNHRTVQFV